MPMEEWHPAGPWGPSPSYLFIPMQIHIKSPHSQRIIYFPIYWLAGKKYKRHYYNKSLDMGTESIISQCYKWIGIKFISTNE